MPLHVDVVAAERSVLSETVDEVLANTPGGQIGVLPRHAPLLTLLSPGEVRLKKGADEVVLAIAGGFMEVGDNRVVILADSAERAEEIDVARAEEARRRALARLAQRAPDIDYERARAALARALARLQAVERMRRRRGSRPPPVAGGVGGAA
ncbi:MAG: F0F1 ATP synthase subunit epsilon [Chloroflexi bacterium]|nr:F0F1 ATP synthase subunit epsilon [Chloroflexota bacterium]